MKWIYLSIAIISEVIATMSLKHSDGFKNLIPSIIVVIGYGIAFYFLSLTLKSMTIGIAYAIWAGAGIVLLSVFGYLFLKQELDLPAIIGLALIVIGVVVINVFSNTVSH